MGLDAFQNASTTRTDPFEQRHQGPKRAAAGRRSGRHGGGGEPLALKDSMRMSTVRCVLQGMQWGEEWEHAAKPLVRNVRDYRTGKELLPHPLIAKLIRWVADEGDAATSTTWMGGGPWTPLSLGGPIELLPSNELLYFQLQTSHAAYYTDQTTHALLEGHAAFPSPDTPLRIQRLKSMVQLGEGRRLLIKKGDDAAVNYENNTAYCTINEIVVAWVSRTTPYLWVFPAWFVVKGWRNKAADTPQRHRQRETVLLRLAPLRRGAFSPPVPAADVESQVCIVHSCTWQGSQKCGVNSGERKHMLTHCLQNNAYEVIDREAGFIANFL